METNEAFPDRETNPTDFDKIEGYKSKKTENMLAEVAGPDQRAAKKMKPGHCTKKNPSRES